MKTNILGIVVVVCASIAVAFCLPAFADNSASSLPQLAAGESLGHELTISAIANLRDVGGYATEDGAAVVRGLVYRSDNLSLKKGTFE